MTPLALLMFQHVYYTFTLLVRSATRRDQRDLGTSRDLQMERVGTSTSRLSFFMVIANRVRAILPEALRKDLLRRSRKDGARTDAKTDNAVHDVLSLFSFTVRPRLYMYKNSASVEDA
uniref:Metalloendopeptidase n=1 Tax=Steinernema glaseri TaxID=37863 RepID=A0A1I7ZEZ7_9BILA